MYHKMKSEYSCDGKTDFFLAAITPVISVTF